ncbi:MAG TPA: CAP domain-containing protein [Terracidiphilus sp.]|nr:CAP domain-containing protein [Terracidiphilus sp.]
MRNALQTWVVCAAMFAPLAAPAQGQYGAGDPSAAAGPDLPAQAEQLLELGNRARSIAGVGRLEWDPALAAAALYHCRWMAQQGPIAHRYNGEPDLSVRANQAGARFGLIEENVAFGSNPATIHEAWMQSPGHRANMLSPNVDRVGIAVIASRGMLYAVADYSRGVENLSAEQVEARVADLMRVSGIAIESDPTTARKACAMNSGFPVNAAGQEPRFVDRWQDPNLDKLPQSLADKLATGNFHSAAIGSCAPLRAVQGAFTSYRVAVLLY